MIDFLLTKRALLNIFVLAGLLGTAQPYLGVQFGPVNGEVAEAQELDFGRPLSPREAVKISPAEIGKPSRTLDGAYVGHSRDIVYTSHTEPAAWLVTATSLRDGIKLWRRAVAVPGCAFSSRENIIVCTRNANTGAIALEALKPTTGKALRTLEGSPEGGVTADALYTSSEGAYVSYGLGMLRRNWALQGFGRGLTGPPTEYHGLLFQQVMVPGATLTGSVFAVNPLSGKLLWEHASNSGLLGASGGTIYLDSTYPPKQQTDYLPITVDSLDALTGRTISSYSYRPDPQLNGRNVQSGNVVSANHTIVLGSLLLFALNRNWYKYSIDKPPQAQRPTKLSGIEDIYVSTAYDRFVYGVAGKSFARFEAKSGALQARVVAGGHLESAIYSDDGLNYAVVSGSLLRFGKSGTLDRLFSPNCSKIDFIAAWDRSVGVVCNNGHKIVLGVTS